MSFTFRPATRSGTTIMLGLAGPSRSGKTYSALRVATGLAQGGPIFFIDTESRRALLYADKFKFMHAELTAPFSSDRYAEAVVAAHEAKAAVCVVDSASHEHEGPGGILEQHETELQRMAGNDYGKREKMKFTAWIRPKAEHNRYVNTLLQLNMHMLFCFRAKDKLELRKDAGGKIVPTSVGWTPICTDRFEYEMTSMLVLPEGAKGIPDLQAHSTGLREPINTMVEHGRQLDEAFGERLAKWAAGAAAPNIADIKTTAPAADVLEAGKLTAAKGTAALRDWWNSQDDATKTKLAGSLADLKALAAEADNWVKDPAA
jgi:AAA domain